ncbi:hypothetical protein SAMN05421819_1665 [Bryocella elongata]|uniref:OmpA family protein n=1 Tax=Bryocella elongata TaxID=863522 RepID=A0A1H5WN19_9BACT|nr:hypothetical protein [Bryocella elongata]SEG00854.1 hypothetical protein SAMN05421819_1665 [Bryocella elongata]
MLRRTILSSAIALGLSLAPAALSAQAPKSASEYPDTHFEIYGGYGYLRPFNSAVNQISYTPTSNLNATASVTGYFNHWFGVQVQGVYFSGSLEHYSFLPTCYGWQCDNHFTSAEAGPVVRWQLGPVVPFVHLLAGGVRAGGPAAQPITWGTGVTGGGGVDLVLPFWNKHLAVRAVQADVDYSHTHFPHPAVYNQTLGGVGDLKAVHLSGGLVYRFGAPEVSQSVMLGCTAEPVSIHPGDPVTVTGSTLYLNPRHKADYTWTANGGQVTSKGETATIDTTGLAPGQYTVSGHVSQGARASQQASCVAPFTVKAFEPPTVTCSANPSTVTSGTGVQISTVGTSPQNRPLTYSYTTSAGQITSNGTTATLNTAGLGATLINIGCSAVDDLGQSATAATSVTVNALPVPVIPQTQSLCSIAFSRDKRRPVRVDNEAKGCLDDVALSMQQHTDAKLVMIGNASPDEVPQSAAERAMNARQYLVQEKGIDPARVELRVGDTSGRTVNDVLVPAGATFNDANTQVFDESTIKRHGQAYGTTSAGLKPLHKRKPMAARTGIPPQQ